MWEKSYLTVYVQHQVHGKILYQILYAFGLSTCPSTDDCLAAIEMPNINYVGSQRDISETIEVRIV